MAKDVINIGVIGFGIVGSGAVQTLQENARAIEMKVGAKLAVKKIADLDWEKPREITLTPEQRTKDVNEIFNDPEIDIVVEAIGGVKPALDFVLTALRNGKHVVTPNKELMAKHGHEILEEADSRHLDCYFEGSVGGGIPILMPLKQSLAGNRIERILGIVNGTTNYILTRMTKEGKEFDEVLTEAKAKGYAEQDPTNDVEGLDAAYKLAILSSIAFNTRIPLEAIYREGITRVAQRDLHYAAQLGYVVKLLAIASDTPQGLELRVHPAFVPTSHALAAVSDVFNAIFVRGSSVGEVMFYGRGAGSRPTGSAVVGDLIEIARNIKVNGTGRVTCTCFEEKKLKPMEEVLTKYYLRMEVLDRPGVLARIATIFGEEQVSIASVVQQTSRGDVAELVWITHPTIEKMVRRSLERIQRLTELKGIRNWIRVEGED